MQPALIELDGVKMPISGWARVAGVERSAISKRLKSGWDVRRAIYTPSRAITCVKADRADVSRLHSEGLAPIEIARALGVSANAIHYALREMQLKANQSEAEAEEHDTATDALCESGEPDRRAIVYGMVCCGTTDEGIAEATGYDPAEVAKFRAELPGWWTVDMRRHKEFDENYKGVGK